MAYCQSPVLDLELIPFPLIRLSLCTHLSWCSRWKLCGGDSSSGRASLPLLSPGPLTGCLAQGTEFSDCSRYELPALVQLLKTGQLPVTACPWKVYGHPEREWDLETENKGQESHCLYCVSPLLGAGNGRRGTPLWHGALWKLHNGSRLETSTLVTC